MRYKHCLIMSGLLITFAGSPVHAAGGGEYPVHVGLDMYDFGTGLANPLWASAIQEMGVEFIVPHSDPAPCPEEATPEEVFAERINEVLELCEGLELKLMMQNEAGGWVSPLMRPFGHPWSPRKPTYWPGNRVDAASLEVHVEPGVAHVYRQDTSDRDGDGNTEEWIVIPRSDGMCHPCEYMEDWFVHDENIFRFDIPAGAMDHMNDLGTRLFGVVYDEPSHQQLQRAPGTGEWPERRGFWANTAVDYAPEHDLDGDGDYDVVDAYRKVLEGMRGVVEHYRPYGLQIHPEHVWASLFHVEARAGMNTCPKLLKSSCPSVVVAMALGAALEWGTDFWVSPDIWGGGGWAPHSDEEFRSTLYFAYWMGASGIYVETLTYSDDRNAVGGKEGRHPGLMDIYDGGTKSQLTAYGEIYRDFIRDIEENYRPHDFRSIRPEIVIVRFPDSCDIPNMAQLHKGGGLYGAWRVPRDPDNFDTPILRFDPRGWATEIVLPPEAQHTAWFAALEHLTFGRIRGALNVYDDFFFPLNNMLVFDHLVGAEHMRDARLIILTGETVSSETLSAIQDRVALGARCLGLPHLMPDWVQERYGGGERTIGHQEGSFVVVPDFEGELAESTIAQYRGHGDEIRYLFGHREIIFKQVAEKWDQARVIVHEFANRAQTAHGASAMASSRLGMEEWLPGNAFDGNKDDTSAAHAWKSKGFSSPEWLAADLGVPIEANRIILHPFPHGEGFPKDFEFQIGSGEDRWTTLPGMTFTDYPKPFGESPSPVVFDFPAVEGRSFRLHVTDAHVPGDGFKAVQIAEMEVGLAEGSSEGEILQ